MAPNHFKYSLLCLLHRFYGIELGMAKGRFPFNLLLLAICVATSLFQLFLIALYGQSWWTSMGDPSRDKFTPFTFMLANLASFISHFLVRWHSEKIRNVLTEVQQLAVDFHKICGDGDGERAVRRWSIARDLLASFHFIFHLLVIFFFYFMLVPEEIASEVKSTTNRTDPDTNMTVSVTTVVRKPFDLSAFSFWVQAQVKLLNKLAVFPQMWASSYDVLAFVLFAFVCACFNATLISLRRICEKESVKVGGDMHITQLFALYRHLSVLVERLDSIFSFLLALWCCTWVLKCSLWIRVIALTTKVQSLEMARLYRMFSIASNFYFFLGASLLAANVNTNLNGFHYVIRKWLPLISTEKKLEYIKFESNCAGFVRGLTFWGFYAFSKSSMLTASATILTYTLILYDLK